MAHPVRLAGHGRRSDGAWVTWTLAEGRRGRRYREVVSLDGVVVHSLLFETGPDRAFTHLELAGPAGLATLHPEGDGTLHGNAVRADGVAHVLGLPLPSGGRIVVEGSVVTGAALAWADRTAAESYERLVVLSPSTLDLTERPIGTGDHVAIDDDGAPALDAGAVWALEV